MTMVMPRYKYYCSSCEQYFEAFHGMIEKLVQCELCSEDSVHIVPSIPFSKSTNGPQKAGQLVKEYIKETKQAIFEEQQKLKKEYKNDS